MATPTASTFTRRFLRLFSAPIIWAVHFLAVYTITGIFCARPHLQGQWLGIDAIVLGICVASAAAIAAICLLHQRDWRKCLRSGKTDFTHWTASSLGLLSIIAILWETIPVFIVPLCGAP
jgi:hypothetical protein